MAHDLVSGDGKNGNYIRRIRRRAIITCFQRWSKLLVATNFKDDREAETVPTRWLITQDTEYESSSQDTTNISLWQRLCETVMRYQ